MAVVATLVTAIWLFIHQRSQTNNKENIKAPHHWTFVMGIHQ